MRRRALQAAAVVACLSLGAAGAAVGARAGRRTPFAASAGALANRCFAVASRLTGRYIRLDGTGSYAVDAPARAAGAFYLKPTGLGTYLLFDRQGMLLSLDAGGVAAIGRASDPGPASEWSIARRARAAFTIISTAARAALTIPRGTVRPVPAPAAGAPGPAGQLFEFRPARGCADYPEAQVGAFGSAFRSGGHGRPVFGFADLHVHITADMRAGGEVIYGESFDRYGITHALSAAGDAAAHGPNGTLDVTGNLIRGNPAGTHDNHGWPTFKGWPTHDTITHQQVYYVWLKRAWMAGLRLIVAQTVDDHSLCEIEVRRDRSCEETASIVGQIQRLYDMQDYIDSQSGGRGRGWFRLVFDPAGARRVIEQGKLAVVIGIESSDPLGCSEFLGQPQCTKADIDRGLDMYRRLGVRTLFPVHWVDNALGGAALESGTEGKAIDGLNVAQTGAPFVTAPCSRQGEVEQPAANGLGPQCNSLGLTPLGAYMIRAMMARHMMIEADHMSERMRDSVIAIAQRYRYPLVSSHNGTGGSWSDGQLSALYALGGVVAVTPDTAGPLSAKIVALQRYARPGSTRGVALGTDTGGLGGQPGPRADAARNPLVYPFRSYDGRVTFVRERTGDFTYDLNVQGVAHYGLLADLIADVQQGHGEKAALPPLFASAEAYLDSWQAAVSDTVPAG